MKKIKLTQGKWALIDREDFPVLNQFTWCAALDKKRGTFYAITNNKSGTVRMARLLMKAPKNKIVDHINHNTLDNRKENLRVCTNIQNARNRKKDKRNTSGFKGVSICTALTRHYKKPYFQAQIRVNYKLINLGYGTNRKELAKLYNGAATKFFGKFANLNQII